VITQCQCPISGIVYIHMYILFCKDIVLLWQSSFQSWKSKGLGHEMFLQFVACLKQAFGEFGPLVLLKCWDIPNYVAKNLVMKMFKSWVGIIFVAVKVAYKIRVYSSAWEFWDRRFWGTIHCRNSNLSFTAECKKTATFHIYAINLIKEFIIIIILCSIDSGDVDAQPTPL